jgi:alkylated DNA repair dioxygenase AlkB
MPAGLLYERELLSAPEEAALLAELGGLPLQEAKFKAYTARRRIAVFDPALPDFLKPLRQKAAKLAGVAEDAFPRALVNEYRPGTPLGWHRDMPEFELVVGAKVFGLGLEPRSVYVLRDEIRWRWQHSVAPTRELRYSITFRTRR